MIVLALVVISIVLSLIAHLKVNKLEEDAKSYRLEASDEIFKLSQELTTIRFELLSIHSKKKVACCNSKKEKEENDPKGEDEPVNKKKRTYKKKDK